MMNLLLPLEGHGPHDLAAAAGFPWGSMAVLLLVLLAAATVFWLWRSGRIAWPASSRPRSAEDDARAILADRFARGDIDGDDFLERASLLNWTPGSDVLPRDRRRR